MSSLKYFELRFTPTGKFFFGKEVSFGQQGDEPSRRSYLVSSQALPQQTTLLGAIRYEILRLNSKLRQPSSTPQDIADAKGLVGNTGFAVKNKQPDRWGTIAGLSPLLLHDGDQYWYPVPLDDKVQEDEPLRWRRRVGKYWELQGLDPKSGLSTSFAPVAGKATVVDDLFFAQALTGNRVSNRYYRHNETSEVDEEGLFRQTFKRNVSGVYQAARAQVQRGNTGSNAIPEPSTFSFTVRIAFTKDPFVKAFTDPNTLSYQTTAILGAEQGTFQLTVTKVEAPETTGELPGSESEIIPPDFSDYLSPVAYQYNTGKLPNTARIVLLSDCYLPESIRDKCRNNAYFLVAKTKSFRFLSSQLDDTRSLATVPWYKPDGQDQSTAQIKPGRRKESKLFTLFERGGVILVPTDKAEEVAKAVNDQHSFRSVGYNYCSIIK